MSIITSRLCALTGYTSTGTESHEADFARRWTAWQARGLAHDRMIHRRLVVVMIAAGATALAACVTYGVLVA